MYTWNSGNYASTSNCNINGQLHGLICTLGLGLGLGLGLVHKLFDTILFRTHVG